MKQRALLLLWCTGAALWFLVWAAEERSGDVVFATDSLEVPTRSPQGDVAGSNHSAPVSASRDTTGAAGPRREPCIDVNVADSRQLQQLPGIGPTIADRICAYRRAHGPIRSLGDLDKVKGLGPARLEKLRSRVCF